MPSRCWNGADVSHARGIPVQIAELAFHARAHAKTCQQVSLEICEASRATTDANRCTTESTFEAHRASSTASRIRCSSADAHGAGAPAEVRTWRAPQRPARTEAPAAETTPFAGAFFRNSASRSPDKLSHPGWASVQKIEQLNLQWADQVALPPRDSCGSSLCMLASPYQPPVMRGRVGRHGSGLGRPRLRAPRAAHDSARVPQGARDSEPHPKPTSSAVKGADLFRRPVPRELYA